MSDLGRREPRLGYKEGAWESWTYYSGKQDSRGRKKDKCWPRGSLKVSGATRGKGVDEEAPEMSGSRILD